MVAYQIPFLMCRRSSFTCRFWYTCQRLVIPVIEQYWRISALNLLFTAGYRPHVKSSYLLYIWNSFPPVSCTHIPSYSTSCKTGKSRITWHWGACAKPLLLWKSNKYYIYIYIYVVQIWPGQTVTCLHTNSSGHIWTTLYIYVCVCVILITRQAKRVHLIYCHLWPVWLHKIFPLYLINGTIFGKNVDNKMCLNFLYSVYLKCFSCWEEFSDMP
jgi:hypothetical protein